MTSTSPSEETIFHISIERDEHEESTDTSCDSHVNTDESTAESDCSVHTDEEPWDFTGKEIVDSHEGITTSVEDLPTATNRHTVSPTTPSQLERSPTLNSWDSLFEESYDEEFPDEFFVLPSDCGNIAMILGPDDWEKLESDNSSENEISDDGGTTSTGRELGQSYDGACDVDSKAFSHSCCHSVVPKDMASYLSCGSDRDPVAVVATSDYSNESSNNSLGDCDFMNENCEDSSEVNQGLHKHNHIIP